MSVTIIDTINNLNVTDDTIVTLKYEDSHEGWHSTGDLEDDAVFETNTANAIAELITDKDLLVRTAFGDEVALDSMSLRHSSQMLSSRKLANVITLLSSKQFSMTTSEADVKYHQNSQPRSGT